MKVYRHACVITVNAQSEVIENAALATEGDRIVYVGPDRPFPGAEEADLTGHVILPGFVNGHSHCPMVMFRGYADDMQLHDWLTRRIFPLEANHTPRTIYDGAMLACLELIRTGTTTVNDMYLDSRQTARALKAAGLSGIVCTSVTSATPDLPAVEALIEEVRETYRGDAQIRTAVGPHAEYTCSADDLARWGELAVATGQPIHIHNSETESEVAGCMARYGMTPTALFEKLGLMRAPMLLAHCVYVTEADMDIIKAHGASVLHNPCSNLKLASGFAPIPRMQERGLPIALATDGPASNNTQDMWEEMRVAALIHKGYTRDPLAVNARSALYMATKGAALALGYADRGSLEAGARADFIVVDKKEPAWALPTDIVNLVVYSGSSRDIVMTVAGGEVLFDRGVYPRLDAEAVIAHARESFAAHFA